MKCPVFNMNYTLAAANQPRGITNGALRFALAEQHQIFTIDRVVIPIQGVYLSAYCIGKSIK
jgi:hypothetical protein